MDIEEALKECPLYGTCVDMFDKIIDEDKCKSGDPQKYVSCKMYNPYIAVTIMDLEKLKALGIKFH